MNIIITGASGFIGTHLIDEFKNKKIVAIGRKFINKHANIQYIECDLSKSIPLIEDDNYEVIIHAAGQAHIQQNSETYDLFIKNNIESTRNVLELAINNGVKKIVFISTIAVLNNNPHDIYAITKKQAEDLIIETCSKYGIQYSIIRPVVVYGENDEKGNVNRLIHQVKKGVFPLFNRGKTVKNMIYVKNLTYLIRKSIDLTENSIIVASDKEDMTIKEICDCIKNEAKVRSILIPIPKLMLHMSLTIIRIINKFGLLRSLNIESIKKLTQDVIVEKDRRFNLPYSSYEGLKKTIRS